MGLASFLGSTGFIGLDREMNELAWLLTVLTLELILLFPAAAGRADASPRRERIRSVH